MRDLAEFSAHPSSSGADPVEGLFVPIPKVIFAANPSHFQYYLRRGEDAL